VLAPLGVQAVREPGVEPGAELRESDQPSSSTTRRTTRLAPAAARRSALPWPPNRTIGRAREVGAVAERLRAEHVRLLTLTGPGGVGKTRLALEAGRAVGADFAGGAHFVSLAAVKRPQDVPAAIVDALAIILLAGESADQAVERFLAAKHVLLVVDNCEHLPAAAPFIGGLPGACPNVTVLTTSREPLAVHAERCHPVPPLALATLETDPDAVARADAVALFCERARAHDPGFDLSADNVGAVAEICRRVDGLPLGIELAAARCGLLSPEQIAERLHAALGTLGLAPRDAPARHRTLRATIDWSHQLLDDDERACFARFAVFAGGAAVEATETITGADIDTLDRLVAKSLLVRHQVHGRTRLGTLETVRAYAAERFAAIADPGSIRERHYGYFLALAQRHANMRAICSTSRQAHLARLDSEVDNVHAALEWAASQGEAAPLLELCEAFGDYWLMRDRHADAVEWIEQALDKPGADRPSAVRVRALLTKAWALWPLGRRGEERAAMAEAVTSARALGDTAVLSHALACRAMQQGFEERLDVAAPLADEALSCARATGDPWTIAMAAWARALAEDSAAKLRERVEQAATLLKETGNAYHQATLYQVATHRALCNGSDRDAIEFSARAIPLLREIGQPYQSMLHLRYAGAAALLRGDTDDAWRAFRECLTLGRDLVVLPIAFEGLRGLAAVAAAREDLDRAARLYGAAAAHRYDEAWDPVDARIDATLLEPARRRRGADAWDAGVREGATLNFEDAISYALNEPRPQPRIPARDAPRPAGPNH
jgi:predicted ATPase